MTIDMTPTAIYKCTKACLHACTVSGSTNRKLHIKEGREYYYACAFDIVYLHDTSRPNQRLAPLTKQEFDAMVGVNFEDTGKRPVREATAAVSKVAETA